MSSKVSLITPCYNGANYINRLLSSILYQTYSNIEMFVINDGSTDNSENIIKSYIPKFESSGKTLSLIRQENQGQGAAVNNGLKLISGDYLIWPDSDDFFASDDTIHKMVNILDKELDYSVVRTFANVLDEYNLKKIGVHGGKRFSKKKKVDLFYDCLFGINGFWYGAGDYMIRVNILKETYPDMNFFVPSKYGGQNWQLLLPVLYKKKCYTLEEFLYNIVDRKLSHSRGQFTSLYDVLKKNEEYEKTIMETLKRMHMPTFEFDCFSRDVRIKYQLNKIDILLLYGYKSEAKEIFSSLTNEYKNIPFKNQVLKIRFKMLPLFYEIKSKLKYSLNKK